MMSIERTCGCGTYYYGEEVCDVHRKEKAMKDEVREAFEKWFLAEYTFAPKRYKGGRIDDYFETSHQKMFEGWKAAWNITAASKPDAEGLVFALEMITASDGAPETIQVLAKEALAQWRGGEI